MKAIQITEPSKMEVIDIEKPNIEDGKILVRIIYVGFCGSDLNTFLGKNPMVNMPIIPGHEVGAVIEELGKNVPTDFKVGLTFTLTPSTSCVNCFSCRGW